jgi:multiple sugar transport system permease protein
MFGSTMKQRRIRRNAFLYFFLGLFSLSTLLPLVWMISTSLKTGDAVLAVPPQMLPDGFNWGNYAKAWTDINFIVLFRNSTFVAFVRLLSEVFVSALVAYGFARFNFPGKNAIFMLLLATIMMPGEVTIIPVFIAFSQIGWVDSYKPLLIPGFLGGQAMFVFLLRQFFLTVPKELEESAYIDGATSFVIFRKIFLPLSIPALITISLFSFQGSWADFLSPLIYLNDPNKFTLPLGLASFKGTKVEWGPLMAGSIMALLPLVIVFFLLQKHFVEGVKLSGIK